MNRKEKGHKAAKKPKILRDVHAEWHGNLGAVILFGEKLDGTEFEMAIIQPEQVPSFAYADSGETFELSDYEDWYNEALEEAHKQGYIIEGEEY